MIHVVEKALNVELNDVVKMRHLHQRISPRYGMLHRSVRSKAITVVAELSFTDRFHDLLNTLLYQPVPDARDAERPCFAVRFRDVFASDRFGPVAVPTPCDNKPHFLHDFFGSPAPDVCNVSVVCACRVTSSVGLDIPIGKQDIFAPQNDLHQVCKYFPALTFSVKLIKDRLHAVILCMPKVVNT